MSSRAARPRDMDINPGSNAETVLHALPFATGASLRAQAISERAGLGYQITYHTLKRLVHHRLVTRTAARGAPRPHGPWDRTAPPRSSYALSDTGRAWRAARPSRPHHSGPPPEHPLTPAARAVLSVLPDDPGDALTMHELIHASRMNSRAAHDAASHLTRSGLVTCQGGRGRFRYHATPDGRAAQPRQDIPPTPEPPPVPGGLHPRAWQMLNALHGSESSEGSAPELQRRCDLSEAVTTLTLRHLRERGLVTLTRTATGPHRYSLTDDSRALLNR